MLKKWRGKSEATVSGDGLCSQNGINGSVFVRPHKINLRGYWFQIDHTSWAFSGTFGTTTNLKNSTLKRDGTQPQQREGGWHGRIKASVNNEGYFPGVLSSIPTTRQQAFGSTSRA